MDNYNKLSLSLKHRINLFLLDKYQILTLETKWCNRCGEVIIKYLICNKSYCHKCCKLYCIDQSNYYKTPSKAPPFNEEALIEIFNHYTI